MYGSRYQKSNKMLEAILTTRYMKITLLVVGLFVVLKTKLRYYVVRCVYESIC